MELSVTGTDFRRTPIELRERLAFEEDAQEEALREMAGRTGAREVVIVSTCNRVEVFCTAPAEARVPEAVRRHLAARGGLHDEHIVSRAGSDAVAHLFRVAAGLDSLVVGEPQILGQLKEACLRSERAGLMGPTLSRVMQRAFAVAKRVRTESGLGRAHVSMGSAAVDLTRKVFGDLEDREVMLVGAGKIGRLVARHLATHGARRIHVLNRSPERAAALAEAIGGTPWPLDTLDERLDAVDVVIASTGARAWLLGRDAVAQVMRRRRGRPILLIDLSVPRNFDPEINKLDNVFLFDADDLQQVVAQGMAARRDHVEAAERLVAEAVAAFGARERQAGATPAIVSLRRRFLDVALAEAARTAPRLAPPGGTAGHAEEALNAMAQAIVNKLLHAPTTRLKSAGDEQAALVAALRRLFDIDDDAGADDGDDAAGVDPAPRRSSRGGR